MKTLMAASLCLLLSAPSAWADLIVNGSFETASPGSSLPTGSGSSLSPGDTSILGWTVTGSTNNIAWLVNSPPGTTTPFGSYFVDLTGYTNVIPFNGVTQTISTVAGRQYVLSFAIGVDQSIPDTVGPAGVSASAGSASQVFTANPPGTGNIWTTETLPFTALASSTVVTLTGTQGDHYIGLDNVSVLEATPVPEGSTLVLLASAVAMLAGVTRLRRFHRSEP